MFSMIIDSQRTVNAWCFTTYLHGECKQSVCLTQNADSIDSISYFSWFWVKVGTYLIFIWLTQESECWSAGLCSHWTKVTDPIHYAESWKFHLGIFCGIYVKIIPILSDLPSWMVKAIGLRVKSGWLFPSGNVSINCVIITPGTLDLFLIPTVRIGKWN